VQYLEVEQEVVQGIVPLRRSTWSSSRQGHCPATHKLTTSSFPFPFFIFKGPDRNTHGGRGLIRGGAPRGEACLAIHCTGQDGYLEVVASILVRERCE